MNILAVIYNKLEEVYGPDVAIRALCGGGCLFLATLFMLLKPQQPIIIINEIQKIEDESKRC